MKKRQDILSPHIIEEDLIEDKNELSNNDASIRPSNLNEFIGQNHIKSNLKVFIQSAIERDSPLDHVILYGPPGLGKTSLAQIVAKERGAEFKSTSGPALSKAAELAAILTNIQKHDILFIDEIHRLSTNIEELLYSAMEDFAIDIVIGAGPAARSVKINIQPFTLIGATTRTGLISKPLRDRFGIPMRLAFYEIEDLVDLIMLASKKLGFVITKQGAIDIAQRSRGTPRIALRLLKRVRDFAIVAKKEEMGEFIVKHALDRLYVDKLGLDSNDYRYLSFISDQCNGRPVGAETIAVGLSEEKDAVEDIIEPFLIQIGLIERTSRGRVITQKGLKHLKDIKYSKSI